MSKFSPESYRHDLEVVRNTVQQAIKDFAFAGVELQFSGNTDTAYTELNSQILPAIKKLYRTNRSAFMALLYRIDIEERKVRQLSENEDDSNFFIKLSNMIIEREFTKVLIRKLFSA